MAAGEPPDGEAAMDLAEQARVQIDQTFFDCPHEMHRALATMYVEDPRFTATYEKLAPGLARWWHDAIHANADRHGTATDEHSSLG
jgi:MerR family transcriptional regulator, thiopeptide resistance regulator